MEKRIDVVPESILNSQFSDDDMAKSAVAFYKKVLDTRYQSAMGSMEQGCYTSSTTRWSDARVDT